MLKETQDIFVRFESCDRQPDGSATPLHKGLVLAHTDDQIEITLTPADLPIQQGQQTLLFYHGEDLCPVRDVSVEGFAIVSAMEYDAGQIVDVKIDTDDGCYTRAAAPRPRLGRTGSPAPFSDSEYRFASTAI